MDKAGVKKILDNGTPQELRALFAFNKGTNPQTIIDKYNIFTRYFFPKYHESPDASFHKDINQGNVDVYTGEIDSFIDIAFRGAGKDVKTKLFIAFAILNDEDNYRRFYKVLSSDGSNSTQTVTDIYNLLVAPRIKGLYPATFAKTDLKREETKGSFITAQGVKVSAGTVGTDQRGDVVEEARPDYIWFNDFETRATLRSRVTTKSIWDNMEEARTGLQKGGGCVYTCLSKDTKFVTSNGVRAFSDFNDGDVVTVLTHTGSWKKSVVKSFGKQELQRIQFKRGKRDNSDIWATKDHNWILRDGTRTRSLKTGDKVLGAPNIFDNFIYEDSTPKERLYWAYGYIFGDGTRIKTKGVYKYSMVRLFGKEVRFLPRFEELGFSSSTNLSLNGDYFVYTGTYLKTLPDPRKDSPELIRAFVRGFLDADGAKGRKDRRYASPFVQMVQTDKHKALDFIRECFPIAGVFITNETNIGGQENIAPDKSKVITRHESTVRFGLGSNFEDKYSNFQFTANITNETKTEVVWCLVVDDDHSFVLDSGISTGNCNYISELGNVHRLVAEKVSPKKRLLIVPILNELGESAWNRYTLEDIVEMRRTDDDFEGERLCKPSASKDVLFDRDRLDLMPIKAPIKESAGFKIYREFNPSHRYGSGHDTAGGVGLDSSTSVFIDFDILPAEVVATFNSNSINPEVFGDEIYREGQMFGGCIQGVENNKFDAAILKARQLGANLYRQQAKDTKIEIPQLKDYGWNTNSLTKSKMLLSLQKAIEDGLLLLNDPDLIAEAKSFSRNELMDKEIDPRLTTRHFDLLMACCIAWQMKDFSTYQKRNEDYIQEETPALYADIGL